MGFNIDFCDFSISGNLEKLAFRVNIINFEYSEYMIVLVIMTGYKDDKG